MHRWLHKLEKAKYFEYLDLSPIEHKGNCNNKFNFITGTKPNVIVVQKTPARRSVTGATPGKTTAVISSPFEKVNKFVVRKELLNMCVQCQSESAKTSNNKIYVC